MLRENYKGITDSTLREGEQTPGVAFSSNQKLEIVKHLVELGVEEIELGVASSRLPWLSSLVEDASAIIQERCLVSMWCRCAQEDISFAVTCNPDILSLSIPVSDIHIEHKLRRSRKWVLETLSKSVYRALELGTPLVSVGFEDASRADYTFLAMAIETAEKSGAKRLRLADTVGIASPGSISKLIRDIKSITSLPVGVHTHNDFGMATANAVAAVESGASWIDATVLGLGERAGNCRLEEIIGFMSLQKEITRYKPGVLRELCKTVSNAAGIAIPPHHPLVGDRIFTCETGLHVQGLIMNPRTYEPYNPMQLGRQRNLLFGTKTGRRAVQSRLDSLGVCISDEQADDLAEKVRHLSASAAAPLVDEDLISLAAQSAG